MKLKINLFTNVFWPEQFLINNMAMHLVGKGHTVTTLASLPNYPKGHFFSGYSLLGGPYAEKNEFGTIIRYPVSPRFNGFVFLALNYVSNLIFSVANLWRLPVADVYFVFASSPVFVVIPAIVLKFFTGKPIVVWYQDLWPDTFFAVTRLNPKSLFGRHLTKVVHWIYRHVDCMLIQSEAYRAELINAGYTGEIEYVPNWAPANSSSLVESEWLKLIPAGKKNLTFAGNIGKAQALDDVLRAMAMVSNQFNDLHLIIVGDGSAKSDLEKQVIDMGLSKCVTFLGRRPAEDMSALFAISDYLLVSLKKDPIFSLTVPSKVQAYMQAGKPIVAFLDGEGARQVLLAECGIVAPAEDEKGLAVALMKLMKMSSDELAKMGQRGQDFFAKHFTESLIVRKIENTLLRYSQKGIK